MKPGQPPPLPERPKLRRGCRLVLHEFGTGPSWVLENPATGKFFRMGMREERLARRLDGSQTIPEMLEKAPKTGDDDTLSGQETLIFLQALSGARLLEDQGEEQPRKKPIFNPLFVKIPFGSPDRFFAAISDRLSIFPFWTTLLVLGVILLTGGYAITSNLERFTATMGNVLSAANIPSFTVCFLFLKFIHETAHGVTCKHFGGRVADAGLYFIFFVPLTYIDATASWRFPSKWLRILVSSAGMIAELVIAAIAALIWASTPVGPLNTLASHTVIVASVTTLFFNANPLMRFDGYFILADLSEVPNLYTMAARSAQSFLSRLFLGVPPLKSYPHWITAYGVACMFWRLSVVFGICIGVIALLHGIGILLAALTLGASYIPVLRAIPRQMAALKSRGVKVSRIRIAVLSAILLFIIFAPINPPPTTPAEIEPSELAPIRVQCPGFVREMNVQPGQKVKAGDLLLRLENREEQGRLDKLLTDAKVASAKANALREDYQPQEMAQQQEQANALQKQAAAAASYIETLRVCAPRDGTIYGRRLEELQDSFVPKGRELLSIGSATGRDAHIAISQELFDRISPAVGQTVQIFIPGRLEVYDATITNVEPSATRDIRYECLTAVAGGSIAVITRQAAGDDKSSRTGMEMVDPHFYVSAQIHGADASTLRPGETGIARFPLAPRQTLLGAAIEGTRAFIKRASDRSTGTVGS